MEDLKDSYFGNTEKRSTFFYIAIVLMLASCMLSVNTDLAEHAQHKMLNIPQWFFTLIFSIDVLMIAAIIAIYFYRKIGVYLLPVLILVHFMLHNYYLSTMLYSDLNALFMYSSAGLFAVIPRWPYFK